jgi:hypothetical protein
MPLYPYIITHSIESFSILPPQPSSRLRRKGGELASITWPSCRMKRKLLIPPLPPPELWLINWTFFSALYQLISHPFCSASSNILKTSPQYVQYASHLISAHPSTKPQTSIEHYTTICGTKVHGNIAAPIRQRALLAQFPRRNQTKNSYAPNGKTSSQTSRFSIVLSAP